MFEQLKGENIFKRNDFNERLWNLKYKLYYPLFKLLPSYTAFFYSSDLLKQYFWGFLETKVIPKFLGIRTPAQAIFNGVKLTIYSFDDLEFLDMFPSFAQLKIKRAIRFAEESWEQNRKITYRQIAFLTCSTTNSISRWIKSCKEIGFNAAPLLAKSDLPTRKTYIAEHIVLEKILRGQINQSYFENCCWDTYSTYSEVQWIAIELALCILAFSFQNKAAEILVKKLQIPERQLREYMGLYNEFKCLIDSYYSEFFRKCSAVYSPLEVLCKAILS